MFEHYRTKAFVLKKVDHSESDQLFNIYSQDFGMIKVLGRGIRKITSKLRSGIPPFSISEVEFVQGKIYKTLTDAILINDFKEIKEDLEKLKICYQISESFCELIKPPQKDEQIWQLLNEIFHHLNVPQLPITNYQLLFYYFLWNLFDILGHKPELYECLNCRKKLKPENFYFSPKGGVICFTCFGKKEEKNFLKIDVGTIKILREILKKDISHILKLKIQKEHQKSLKEISNFYLPSIIF